MAAIATVREAYARFPLGDEFTETACQVLREGTVAQVSYESKSLGLALKLFVSEMEHEGGVYVASPGTDPGYRETNGWVSPWDLTEMLASIGTTTNNLPLERLRQMDFFSATCSVQLQSELEWFSQNLPLIIAYINRVD